MENKKLNNRMKIIISLIYSLLFIFIILILSYKLSDEGIKSNLLTKSLKPSIDHIFGTDWLGRDMFTRTIKGLKFSLEIAFTTSLISLLIAIVLGAIAALGGKLAENVVSWLIDLFIGMPHIVFMILISFLVGGGKDGIIYGVGLTHWPTLTRLVKNKIQSILNEDYVMISKRFGKNNFYIFFKHILPHIIPVSIVGFILLFPHIILHESTLTFLGFGLSPQTPAIGIILSEGMGNISAGKWWLLLYPAIMLIVFVKFIDNIGNKIEILIDPTRFHE